jgi:hypothetical protein
MKKVLIIIGAVLVALVLFFVCVGAMTNEGKDSGYQIPDSGSPVSLKADPKTSPRPNTIREGIWEVGTDAKPGKYKTKGAQESVITLCAWTVKKGEEFLDGGTVDKTTAQGIVTLKAGQTFETRGCQEWYLVK